MSYSGTPTLYGEQQLAAAYTTGVRQPVVSIAVGDGNGAAVTPTESQTSLVHEVWRGAITSWGVDPADTRRIVVHTTIPATAGPFTVREAGVYDQSGNLVCVTALAATEVVAPGSGNQSTSIDLTVAMPIGSAGALTVSPTQGERFTIERLYRTPFISINSATVTVPPASPAIGDLYIIPTGATGAWATATVGTIAEWNGTFWAFLTPPAKMVGGIMDQADDGASEYLKWTGAAWEPFAHTGDLISVTDGAGASTADELVGAASPGITAYQPNQIFRWRKGAAANATTTPHGNVGGLGDKLFTKADGSALAVGDLPPLADFLASFDGTEQKVLGMMRSDVLALIAANAPKLVIGSVTLYVRPGGNDTTGDGSANTDAKAFATIQGAINYAVNQLSVTGKVLRIQLGVANNTYAAPTSIPTGLSLIIQGDSANQDAYTIAGSGSGGSSGVIQVQGSVLQLIGVQVQNTGTVTNTLSAQSSGAIIPFAVTLSATLTTNPFAAIDAMSGGSIAIAGPIKVTTNIGYVMTSEGAIVVQTGAIITLGAGFTVTGAVCNADTCGTIIFANSSGWSGSATGKKFSCSDNGVINTFGQGVNWIPGSIAGTQSTQGLYN